MRKYIIILILQMIYSSIFSESLKTIIDEYVRYNKFDEAIMKLENFISSNSSDSDAYALYAALLNENKKSDEAIIAYRKAIAYEDSEEKKGEYYFNIANIYYQKDILDIAKETYQKALTHNNMLSSAYYMIGLINFNQGNTKQTIENWKRYVLITNNFEKKEKITKILSLINQKIAEEKLRKEEEERRKKEIMELLKESTDDKESTSYDDYSIEETKDLELFEDID